VTRSRRVFGGPHDGCWIEFRAGRPATPFVVFPASCYGPDVWHFYERRRRGNEDVYEFSRYQTYPYGDEAPVATPRTESP
jgi:hypothetical protein